MLQDNESIETEVENKDTNVGSLSAVDNAESQNVSSSVILFDYLKIIKTILNIKTNEYDDVLNIILNTTILEILNYCNIDKIPAALNYTVCQLVSDVYLDLKNENSSGIISGNISSITEDGRSVTFSQSESLKIKASERVSKLVLLQRHRKLYRI